MEVLLSIVAAFGNCWAGTGYLSRRGTNLMSRQPSTAVGQPWAVHRLGTMSNAPGSAWGLRWLSASQAFLLPSQSRERKPLWVCGVSSGTSSTLHSSQMGPGNSLTYLAFSFRLTFITYFKDTSQVVYQCHLLKDKITKVYVRFVIQLRF